MGGALAAQDEPDWIADLDARVREIVRDPGARDTEVVEELLALEGEMGGLFGELEEDARLRVELILYIARTARAKAQPNLSRAERFALQRRALEHARAAKQQEAILRAGLLVAEYMRVDGRLKEALGVVTRVLEESPHALGTLAFGLLWRADLERQLGLFEDAFEHLDAAEAARRPGDPWLPLGWRIPGVRGRAWLELGVLDLAARSIERETQAFNDAHSGTAVDGLAVRIHAVELDLARGHAELVMEGVQNALAEFAHAEDTSAWRGELRLLGALGTADAARRNRANVDLAAEQLTDALTAVDLPARARLSAEIRLAEIELLRGRNGRAAELLRASRLRLEGWRAQGESVGPLLEEAELSTAEVRLALLDGADLETCRAHYATLARAVDERLKLWEETPLRAGGLGFLQHAPRRAWTSALIRMAAHIHGDAAGTEALKHMGAAHRAGTLYRRLGEQPGESPASWHASLKGSGDGVLLYLPGPHQSHVIALDEYGARLFELTNERELLELRRRHAAAMARGEPLDNPATEALCRALFPPQLILRLAPWEGLTIIGAELLGATPFALLAPLGRPLGLTHALAHAASLPLLNRLLARAEARPPPTVDLVLFAAPSTSPSVLKAYPNAVDLRLTDEHLAEWTAPFEATSTWVRRGTDASQDELRRAPLAQARVLAFFGHGVSELSRERPAALVFSPDATSEGLLGCDEVEALSAPPFVLLSACHSAEGPSRPGDQVGSHQGGAWLFAGAGVALVATGELDTGLAHTLCCHILASIAQGASPAEALRDARREVAQSLGPESFARTGQITMLGLGHKVLFPPSPSPLSAPWSLALTVAAIGSLGLLIVRRRSGARRRRH